MEGIQAQYQIRQNALAAQEYAQDLLKWQQDLKAKHTQTGSKQQQSQQHPGVRGRAPGDVPAPRDAQQPALQPEAKASRQSDPAAHTYKNYSKWDTFDTDAALADVDRPTPASKPPSQHPAASSGPHGQQHSGMLEPRVPNAPVAPVKPGAARSSSAAQQTPAARAAALKEQGNKLYQAKYFDDAISCYTQSIEAHPTAVAYANRAMALLKQDKFAEAEADCSAAVDLDPMYIKAWHRRGTARRQMGKYLDAAADFEAALRLEPSNTAVQADRDAALSQHLTQQQIQRSTQWHPIPVTVLPPVQESPQDVQVRSGAPDQAAARKPQPPSAGTECMPKQLSSPQQQHQQQSQLQPQQGASKVVPGVQPSGDHQARPITPTSSSSSKASSTQASPQQRQAVAAAAEAAARQLAARLSSSLKAPRTGHEFESAWRRPAGRRGATGTAAIAAQGKYLRLLQPSQLPVLFKSSLTAQLLTALLIALLTAVAQPPPADADTAADAAAAAAAADSGGNDAAQQLQPSHAVSLMEGLVGVSRFDMMAMSVGSRDKAAMRQLWEAAAAAVGDTSLGDRLSAVRPKFRL